MKTSIRDTRVSSNSKGRGRQQFKIQRYVQLNKEDINWRCKVSSTEDILGRHQFEILREAQLVIEDEDISWKHNGNFKRKRS